MLIMTENDVNPLINNDPMDKRNEFIDHPSYLAHIYSRFHKYHPRRSVFVCSPPINFFLHLDFSRIIATCKETYYAIYWNAYRVYAINVADMFMV